MTRPLSRWIALGVAVLAMVGWIAAAVGAPGAALQGWLIGFVFMTSLSLGSLAALLVHRLTGGAWGGAFAPELAPAAAATPLLLLYVIPILLGVHAIYPWAATPQVAPADVRQVFLNPALFWIASLAALGGWSAMALDLRRIEAPRGRLTAGLGLAFHGVALSVVGVYWIMSVVPSFTSSDFGMGLAVQQFAAAFAWAGLQGRRRVAESPAGDLAGLLFATIVGLTYLEFMSYLVVWYGDRPPLDAWYLTRARAPWQVLVWVAMAFGAAAIVLLVVRRAFATHRALALASACVLAALFCYQTWLLAPSFGVACLGPGVLALVAMGGLWIALAGGLPRLERKLEGLVHG